MVVIAAVLAWLGLIPPLPTLCRCGHDAEHHEHWRDGSDCGTCGPDVCDRFRRAWRQQPDPEPVDLAAVCRDHQVIEAVRAGDIDYALAIADPEFVALVQAFADAGRAR